MAGGATFAAFPEWYATMFSGFYLALLALLVALIVRNIGVEFWAKGTGARWRAGWEWAVVVGSAVPALLLGVAWANIAHGVPIGTDGEYAGSFWTLLNPYALAGGVMSLTLFLAHGAHFLALRTTGMVHDRAVTAARLTAPVALVTVVGFVAWTLLVQDGVEPVSAMALGLAVVAAAGAVLRSRGGREGWAFGLSALAVLAVFVGLFAWLFPNAMPSTETAASTLTLREASSSSYTLTVMTVVAAIFTPLVLLYQGWTYWVFRRRVSAEAFRPAERTPLDAISTHRHPG